jgi:hypothetical protein
MSADPSALLQLIMGGGQQQQNPVLSALSTEGYQFPEMMKAMQLTPQEQFLYQYHMRNLLGSGKIMQPNGDVSTLLQAVVTGPNGRYYNIPTVWGGKQLDPRAAAEQAAKIGWEKWPSYDTPEAADTRYMKMHDFMDKDVGLWLSRQGKQ